MEMFEISEKALDRCDKKYIFRANVNRCLQEGVCPKCGEDTELEEKSFLTPGKCKCTNSDCGIVWEKGMNGEWDSGFKPL